MQTLSSTPHHSPAKRCRPHNYATHHKDDWDDWLNWESMVSMWDWWRQRCQWWRWWWRRVKSSTSTNSSSMMGHGDEWYSSRRRRGDGLLSLFRLRQQRLRCLWHAINHNKQWRNCDLGTYVRLYRSGYLTRGETRRNGAPASWEKRGGWIGRTLRGLGRSLST